MKPFAIIGHKEEQKHGEYRTKRQILEIYDKMTEAIRPGQPYRIILKAHPADPSISHPE